MTEDQARAALRAFVAVGAVEPWSADQPWQQAVARGWAVMGEFHGYRFRVEAVSRGVRVNAFIAP